MFDDERVFASCFVNREPAARADAQTVFGCESEQPVLHSKASTPKRGGFILQSEVPVARSVPSKVGYLALDANVEETAFDQNLEPGSQLGNAERPSLLHQLFKKG